MQLRWGFPRSGAALNGADDRRKAQGRIARYCPVLPGRCLPRASSFGPRRAEHPCAGMISVFTGSLRIKRIFCTLKNEKN